MSGIQKANSLATWWTGTSPKYGIKKRIHMKAGLTDEECQLYMKKVLENADKNEDKRKSDEAFKKTDEYVVPKIWIYKQRELDSLKQDIQQKHDRNNSSFMGGYTGPAILSHKAEVDRIKIYEEQRKAEIEKKYDGSRECIEYVRKFVLEDDEKQKYNFNHHHTGNKSLSPRVGGYAGRHAAAHGGGFNHPGVYAGGVWN